MSSNLLARIAVAAVAIPGALAFIYLGGWVLTALLAFLGVAGAVEVYRLAAAGGTRASTAIGLVGAALAPVLAYLLAPGGPALAPLWAAVGAALWLMAVMGSVALTHHPTARPLAAIGITVFGALYAGALPGFLLVLRHGPGLENAWAATWLVLLPLVVTWIGDTAAMAGGSLIGGRKLAPVLSPKKTWAGAITGAASAVIVAPVFGALALAPFGLSLGWWQLIIFGLVVSIMGQVGDVAESLLKREVGMKDSGGFFPGHGGVLDRFDALYWAVPAAVALYKAFGIL